jgi:hypothetical protein
MNLSSSLLTVNENATFTGIITVNGGGIDIDNDDDIRLRFDNAGTFKAGLQVATTAGDMITGSAINDFAIRAQGNMLFSSGGNVEVLRLDTSGNATFAGTVTAADLLTVNGDGHLFLGADGETPKIDMLYTTNASGRGWDTRIFTGKTDDLPNAQNFPTSTIAGGYGTQYQANSDGAFFGIIPYTTGNYRPIINWGDDVSDTPFSFQFNGTDIVTINYAGGMTAPSFTGDHRGTINTATTGFTQTAGNNSTLIATTEYADAAAAAVDPSGVYLPLTAGSGERVTGDLYISDKLYMRPSATYGSGYKVMHVTGTGNAPYPTIIHFSNYAKSSVMVINDENVGIGVTGPQSKLQVDGGIQMADDTDAASATKVGTMRYRTGTEYVEVTGTELIPQPLNFTSGWNSIGSTTTITADTFVTVTSAGGIRKPTFLTVGQVYRLSISGTTTTTNNQINNYNNNSNYKTWSGAGAFDFTFTFTATTDGGLYLRLFPGTAEIYSLSVMEVTEEEASYADMCMQTGASTYEWVNILRNTY